MEYKGHLVDVGWDGQLLRLRATNADGRSLANISSDDSRLELPVAEIAEVWFRDAPRGVGGVLLITGTDGEAHRLHFRRDTRDAFHELYVELSAALALRPPVEVVVDLTERADETAPDADLDLVSLEAHESAGVPVS